MTAELLAADRMLIITGQTSGTPEPPLRRSPMPVREPAAAVRVVPISPRHPGPASAGAGAGGEGPATQGTLALALPWEAPAAITFTTHDHGSRRGVTRVPASSPGGPEAGRPGGSSQVILPEPRDWAATFAQAAMEVAMGQRASTQLIRWTSPEVQEALARRGALVARLVHRSTQLAKPRLRALQLCLPSARACEVAAVMADSEKVRAMAFRMEGNQGRWRVTAFEIG